MTFEVFNSPFSKAQSIEEQEQELAVIATELNQYLEDLKYEELARDEDPLAMFETPEDFFEGCRC